MANLKTKVDNDGVTSTDVGTSNGTVEFKVKRVGSVQEQVRRVSGSVGAHEYVTNHPFVIYNPGGSSMTASLPPISTNNIGAETWVLTDSGNDIVHISGSGDQLAGWAIGGPHDNLKVSGSFDSVHLLAVSSSADGHYWHVLNDEFAGNR